MNKLIEKLKFDYVNSSINKQNFPKVKVPAGTLELFTFSKEMTGHEIVDEIEEHGLRPATIHEFLKWAPKNWKEDWVLILGSRWTNPGGFVNVPCACVVGACRRFGLDWFDDRFYSSYRVLVSRPSKSSSQGLSTGKLGASADTIGHLKTRIVTLETKLDKITEFFNNLKT